MTILAIDTTAKEVTTALLQNETILASASASASKCGSETILPLIESILSATGKTIRELELVALAVGPGSFTGVRVGVAMVKGMLFGRDIPVAPVDTLEALAENLAPMPGLVVPAMDARRSEIYTALFEIEGGLPRRLTEDRGVSPAILAEEIARRYPNTPVSIVGDGRAVALPAFTALGIPLALHPQDACMHSASSVGRVGFRMAQRGETVSASMLSPLYLRPAQPDEPKKKPEGQS